MVEHEYAIGIDTMGYPFWVGAETDAETEEKFYDGQHLYTHLDIEADWESVNDIEQEAWQILAEMLDTNGDLDTKQNVRESR